MIDTVFFIPVGFSQGLLSKAIGMISFIAVGFSQRITKLKKIGFSQIICDTIAQLFWLKPSVSL